MIVEVTHPETGERFSVDVPNLTEEKLAGLTREYATTQKLKSHLDKLPVSAEVKAVLHRLSQFAIKVGETIVAIGRRVLEIGLLIARKFPNATIGLIVGAILTLLLAMVPFVGPALSSIIGTLATIYTTGSGFLEDLKANDPRIVDEIKGASEVFRPLGATA